MNECELIMCDEECIQGPAGPLCACPTGQVLGEDGRSCSKLHPCEEWGTCSQLCDPTNSTYKCSCKPGYALQDDGFSCKSIGN